MEDAVRPNEAAFKAAYERGYRTWAQLWHKAVTDGHQPEECLSDLHSAFPNHPSFPNGLKLDKRFGNTVIAKGRTTWKTSTSPCDLPSFHEDVCFQVASRTVTTATFTTELNPATTYFPQIDSEKDHFTVLFLAWAYLLSARWVDLVPGARGPACDNIGSHSSCEKPPTDNKTDRRLVVDIGDADEGAANWWTAVLSSKADWRASIQNSAGTILYSPWSIRIQKVPELLVSVRGKVHVPSSNQNLPSFKTAMGYLTDYCTLHDAGDQSQMVLAAALLIPLANLDNRIIQLPIPSTALKPPKTTQVARGSSAWAGEIGQLDRLLTLSCNPRGVKSLLSSVLFDPEVDCNVCGAWLQGSFAFLDSDMAKDPRLRLQALINRDPSLGFLWFGAFLTGADARCLRDARSGWWKLDLNVAAWTGTHISFIQEPVASSISQSITRADECRLAFLAHEGEHSIAPLFPFRPFGFTAVEDTDLEVREHIPCAAIHALTYESFTWESDKLVDYSQKPQNPSAAAVRYKTSPVTSLDRGTVVTYDNMDMEEETSEMVTRNIFAWLRGENGYPVAERAIWEHEWIADWDSDEEISVNGDVRSTAENNLGRWLIHSATQSSYSI